MLGWLNVDRAAVIVAIVAVAVSMIYGWWQTSITRDAREQARRSADAAEKQAAIAETAKDEARRAADAAAEAVEMEARRDHLNGAVKDVELLRVELRQQHRDLPHPDQWAVFRNNGNRAYQYKVLVEYSPTHHSHVRTGTIEQGETLAVYLAPDETRYGGIVMWIDGECPCGKPDGDQGHWRKFWQAPTPVVPEDEPPNIY